ncbi:hypothetical protein EDM00_09605 [Ornithobacterium rhinotracheale]|uniref:hypothetical protein n=1 Tax=Ornithobacterium rhinotracheale TaxID=28251 RepID=UPI00129C45DA|nr:hypothetical protein [Ornithobacterium rhinotracheale]MRI64243.1 hypothetical protein [Ornithobacterium rhinotracheale]MRJ09275.1 hypothetical protein [Ornithobacterium rhinotracheale]UOH77802.1 hypothetical protein MT996_11450 [Ornithobacterium rhinotracheale]
MTLKFISIVLFVYIIYYAGNIIYDLFLKKDKPREGEEEVQQFTLGDLAKETQEEIVNVDIDEAEEINAPESFITDEPNLFESEEPQRVSLSEMQRKFEEESKLEETESEKPQKNENEEENAGGSSNENEKEVRQNPKKRFKDILKEAETSVRMIDNIDGEKVYNIVQKNH